LAEAAEGQGMGWIAQSAAIAVAVPVAGGD